MTSVPIWNARGVTGGLKYQWQATRGGWGRHTESRTRGLKYKKRKGVGCCTKSAEFFRKEKKWDLDALLETGCFRVFLSTWYSSTEVVVLYQVHLQSSTRVLRVCMMSLLPLDGICIID